MIDIGLIVNPVAGLGGSVGLKGTDGMVEEALRRGAEPLSNERAASALRELLPVCDRLRIWTGSGELGARISEACGFETHIVYEASESTDSEDTKRLAQMLADRSVSLILFAGGDGTAADLYEAVGERQPVLGIPAGVKIYSPVYATTPAAAGEMARLYITGERLGVEEAEVLDIDEELYRQGFVDVRLRGYLTVPKKNRLIQNRKAPSPLSEQAAADAIAATVIRDMEPGACYLIGAGTTTRRIMEQLDLSYTLIGVDMVCDKELVEPDVYGNRILELAGHRPLKLVLSVTGGQGFLLGRGNQQLTPAVLARIGADNLTIVATQLKLASLGGRPLLLDTGSEALDRAFSGYYKVITGPNRYVVARVGDVPDR